MLCAGNTIFIEGNMPSDTAYRGILSKGEQSACCAQLFGKFQIRSKYGHVRELLYYFIVFCHMASVAVGLILLQADAATLAERASPDVLKVKQHSNKVYCTLGALWKIVLFWGRF